MNKIKLKLKNIKIYLPKASYVKIDLDIKK